jgi:putative SOS response-associated peptidase YedK
MSASRFAEWLDVWRNGADDLARVLAGMTQEQLDTPYREEGWTVTQLVHHMADSHINAYTRVRLMLTEANPAIKPYDEKKWACLPDNFTVPVSVSVDLLKLIHTRTVALLQSCGEQEWVRTYFHPEQQKIVDLYTMTGIYAWHIRHHIAHIENLKKRNGWN